MKRVERTKSRGYLSALPTAVNYSLAYSLEKEFNISGPTLRSERSKIMQTRAYTKSSNEDNYESVPCAFFHSRSNRLANRSSRQQ